MIRECLCIWYDDQGRTEPTAFRVLVGMSGELFVVLSVLLAFVNVGMNFNFAAKLDHAGDSGHAAFL